MKTAIIFILAAATVLRLLLSFAILPGNTTATDNDDVLARALGPGILPAVGAAILDPVHTWDHLEEACFWLENGPSSWTDSWGESSGGSAGYGAIYTPGTRVVAPPLVVAFLGETLVCPGPESAAFRAAIRKLLLLIADAVGAFCIYRLGMRTFDVEKESNEEKIERHTRKEEEDDDLVVPGILRPQRGWVFGLSSKKIPPEESLKNGEVNHCAGADHTKQKEDDENGDAPIGIATSALLDSEPIITLDQLPIFAAASYFCNPISMLANATGSTRSLWDALLLLSFCYVTLPPARTTKENIPIKVPSATKAMFCLSVATYADAGYSMFLLPIMLWRGLLRGAQTQPTFQRGQHQDWKTVVVLYIFYLGGLHFLASMLVGGDSSTYRSVMVQTMLPNIAFIQQDSSGSVPGPSMGLHWYMFVQVFDRFRPYFTVFVSGVAMMFAIPLTTRLYRYPSVLVATFQLLWAIFRPTTTVHTLTLGLHLAALNPRTIARMRNPSLISFFALPVPILLFVTFHRMWLVTGNGNPNYIYFQCFAYGMFVCIITMEFVSATVKRDKVRRMVEKGSIRKILAEKKKEEEKVPKDAAKVDYKDGPPTEEKKVEEKNGTCEKVAEDIGNGSDREETPEPVVVFL